MSRCNAVSRPTDRNAVTEPCISRVPVYAAAAVQLYTSVQYVSVAGGQRTLAAITSTAVTWCSIEAVYGPGEAASWD